MNAQRPGFERRTRRTPSLWGDGVLMVLEALCALADLVGAVFGALV